MKMIKRLFDIIFSLFFIALLMIPFLIISFLILLKIGSPIFFIQERVGYKDKIFKLYKFRTMTNKKNIDGNLLPDSERLTKFGRLLRATSIDELPELFNILVGQMSFVGPRPLLVDYLEYYDSDQIRRHEVKPGLTGWAQINGRNSISWEEKFKLDIWYVDHFNLFLDLKIILITIKKVLKREGIEHSTYLTMPKFTGNKSKEGFK